MVRFCFILLCAAAALAQTPQEPAKPPADVDQALRARVEEFFQDHVTAQFRKAEALVAEDSKDYYYNHNKPHYLKFLGITNVHYSDNFTKAAVSVNVLSPVAIPGFGGGPPTVPIPSTWKIEDGKWCWYVEMEPFLRTPFGIMRLNSDGTIAAQAQTAAPTPAAATAPPAAAPPSPAGASGGSDLAAMAALAGAKEAGIVPGNPPPAARPGAGMPPPGMPSGMMPGMPGAAPPAPAGHFKADHDSITLASGESGTVTFSNSGDSFCDVLIVGSVPGVAAKLDRTRVQAGQKAVLTLDAGSDAKSGVLKFVIPQTAEMLTIQIKIEQ
jgi:hypothetical protein